MEIGIIFVYLVILYVKWENVERENFYMLVMMIGKWNYVWFVGKVKIERKLMYVCWLNVLGDENNIILLVG